MFGLSGTAIAGIAGAVGTVAGAGIGADSASAGNYQQRLAAERDRADQERIYQQQREDSKPYREAGVRELGSIEELLKNYRPTTAANVMSDPGYQFGMEQGRNALEGSASARGGLYSGATLKALNRFGNDYATTKFGDAFNRNETQTNNAFNRSAAVAGIGQTANGQAQAAGQNYGNALSNANYGVGNSNASTALAQGNAFGGAVNRLSSYGNQNNWWQGGGAKTGQAGNAGYGDYTDPSWFPSA
jgi:hypothetical protein